MSNTNNAVWDADFFKDPVRSTAAGSTDHQLCCHEHHRLGGLEICRVWCMRVMLQPMQRYPPMRMQFSKALRKLGSVILMTLRPFRPSKALIQELAWPCQQEIGSCMCVQPQQQPSACHPFTRKDATPVDQGVWGDLLGQSCNIRPPHSTTP